MGSGGVAIAALPTVICLKVSFSDGLGGVFFTHKLYRQAKPLINFAASNNQMLESIL